MTSDKFILSISGALIVISTASVLALIIGFGLPIEIGVIPLIVAMIIVGIIFTIILFETEKHILVKSRRN